MRLTVAIIFVLFASLVLVSCGKRENRARNATLSAATGFDVQPVEAIDEQGFKQLASQRKGKALFVNLWATWCQPCVEEFADIVKLANELSGKDVEFIAISFDYPDEVESKILPFLRDKKVPFKVYVADVKDQEAFINTVNSVWSGALPATVLYDAAGKQKAFLVGQQSLESFKKEINKLRRTS